MLNFIELTTTDDKNILLNVTNISSISPASEATSKVHGFNTYIVMSNQLTDDDYFTVKEHYEVIVERIKRCTSAMVIQ